MKLEKIIRERKLPYTGEIAVSIGDKVEANQVVAEMNYYPGLVHKVNISKKLAIDSSDIEEVINVKQGQLIHEGDIIAFNSHWNQAQVIASPQTGVVGMISKHLGQIYIRKLTKFDSIDQEVHDISELLETKGEQTNRLITVKVGQSVIPNQVIAKADYKIKRFKIKTVNSKIFGEVVSIKDNVITIKNTQLSPSIKAYLSGKVIDVIDKKSVKIQANVYRLNGVYGLGDEKTGEVRVVESDSIHASNITSSDENKIIFIRGHLSENILNKAKENRVAGIVCASCDLAVMRNYAGSKFIPGITGTEEIVTNVILLKGFKRNIIDETTWANVLTFNNYIASINGTTHIRAGAIRPEVLVFVNTEKE